MSYQGQQLPGPGNNGTWSGNGSPQRQQYWVDQQQMPPQANSMAMNGNHHSINHQQQYYTAPPPPHNGQPMYQNQNHNHNQFQQNGAYHPNVTYHPPPQLQNQNHAPQRAPQLQVQHQHAPPPPQPTNTQFINPSEIFSNPPSNQNTPQRSQMGQRVSSGLSAKMAPARPGENAENGPLMMALAEEYIEAAHALAPTITSSMTAANLDEYHKLIAMGLALLESALKNTKLAPRDEAKVRLRYAGVLYEETNNSMEAETALSKGISLCERNKYKDLEYAMHFLFAQILFRKKTPKAAMSWLDKKISDTETYKHYSWVYAFRFLRASYSLTIGSLAEINAATTNLNRIRELSKARDDRPINFAACVIEAMAHLKTNNAESLMWARRAIAGAWGSQVQNGQETPQLVGLAHFLDVVCSIRQGDKKLMHEKLREMQRMMDGVLQNPNAWSSSDASIAIPINRHESSSEVVSPDTRMILKIGNDGRDNLMLSFLDLRNASGTMFLLGGILVMNKQSSSPINARAIHFLKQGLTTLETVGSTIPDTLPGCISKASGRDQLKCHIICCMAFCAAAIGKYTDLKVQIEKCQIIIGRLDASQQRPLLTVTTYLSGLYYQGIGDLKNALRIYEDKQFDISSQSITSTNATIEREFAILAALNSLLLLQDPTLLDTSRNIAMLERLRLLCEDHPNKDIKAAFHLAAATVKTTANSGTTLETKTHLSAALTFAGQIGNVQFTSLTLIIMCRKFFVGVIGDQSEKSANAASEQARMAGNPLWMSVADGLLASCLNLNGKSEEAQQTLNNSLAFAKRAMPLS